MITFILGAVTAVILTNEPIRKQFLVLIKSVFNQHKGQDEN